MSSRRKRSQGSQADAFDSPSSNLDEFANLLYSTGGGLDDELRRLDTKPTRIRQIPLHEVRPDPAQARRVMPGRLRIQWLQHPDQIPTILDEWLQLANEEATQRQRPTLNVTEALRRDPNDTTAVPEDLTLPEIGPIESSFTALVQLAASIHLHGLANPITVTLQDDDTYMVETGERRFLAYNLLHNLPDFVQGAWDHIPSRVVENRDIWRQAAENGARQDLNAVSMARQLALLLMDIYADRYSFAKFSDMPGRDWYAQVHDSKKYPVPYGRGAELAAAMGLKSANQIRQYRQLLALPNEVWQLADELNWTEYFCRQLMKKARSVTTVTDVEGDTDESVTTVTDYQNALVALAQQSAGLIDDLPPDIKALLTPPKPEKTTEPQGELILRNVDMVVLRSDTKSGTLTLKCREAELLENLHSAQFIAVTIRTRDVE